MVKVDSKLRRRSIEPLSRKLRIFIAATVVVAVATAGAVYVYQLESEPTFIIPSVQVHLMNPNLYEVNVSFYLDGIPLPFFDEPSSTPQYIVTVPCAPTEGDWGGVGGHIMPQENQEWDPQLVLSIWSDLYEDDYVFAEYPHPYVLDIALWPSEWGVSLIQITFG